MNTDRYSFDIQHLSIRLQEAIKRGYEDKAKEILIQIRKEVMKIEKELKCEYRCPICGMRNML